MMNFALKMMCFMFGSIVSVDELAEMEEYKRFLKNVPLFEALSETEVREVASGLIEEAFR